jgi:uncharacterized protein YqhQ
LSVKSFIRLAAHTQLLPVLESGEETTLVGGQAVIEGVMMRAPHSYCIAVRKPNGEVITQEAPLQKVSDKYPIFRLPVFRGVGTLGQAMYLGVKALRFSANAALEEEQAKKGGQKQEISGWAMTLNLAFSFAFFVFLYKFIPLYLTSALATVFPSLNGQVAFNAADGIIRLAIFLTFLAVVSRWKDIRRVFEYHGAEHKVVFNFESGKPVTVENAQRFKTLHPRCGTSFLLVVMVISAIIYTFMPFESFAGKFAARVFLIPVIAGISYELIRFASKRQSSVLAQITTPGLWLQRITTKPPSDDQTEIAIRALDGAMVLERQQGGELVIA